MNKLKLSAGLGAGLLTLVSCSIVQTSYDLTKGSVTTAYKTAKLVTRLGVGTVRMTYKLGAFTFDVITAPLEWPLTHDLDSVGGLPPKEAIAQGKVKNSPYVVKGKRYVPMSVEEARTYKETGIASWYGEETLRQKDGHMTANGEAFDPAKPTAAHKYLPLPMHVKVTNQENGRTMVVRVNDRGPFVEGRVIDLSAGAAKQLGFHRNGTAKVLVEIIEI